MATETHYPDAFATALVALTGSVTDIDEDPDAKSWTATDPLRATSNNVSTTVHCSFPAPTGNLTTGADLQEFRVLLRPYDAGQTGDPDWRIELWESNGIIRAGSNTEILNDAGDTVVSFTWDASEIAVANGSGVEIKVFGVKAGGAGGARNTVDIGAIEWNATYTPSGDFQAAWTQRSNQIL